jgi:hypothetical protein
MFPLLQPQLPARRLQLLRQRFHMPHAPAGALRKPKHWRLVQQGRVDTGFWGQTHAAQGRGAVPRAALEQSCAALCALLLSSGMVAGDGRGSHCRGCSGTQQQQKQQEQQEQPHCSPGQEKLLQHQMSIRACQLEDSTYLRVVRRTTAQRHTQRQQRQRRRSQGQLQHLCTICPKGRQEQGFNPQRSLFLSCTACFI